MSTTNCNRYVIGIAVLCVAFVILILLIEKINKWVTQTNDFNIHMRRRLIEMELEIDMMRAEVWRNDDVRRNFLKTFA